MLMLLSILFCTEFITQTHAELTGGIKSLAVTPLPEQVVETKTVPMAATGIATRSTALGDGPSNQFSVLLPITVSYYRLRLKYKSTSDWTTLDIQHPSRILAWREIAISGISDKVQLTARHMELRQPQAAATANQQIVVTTDFAVRSDSVNEPLFFLLRKGGLNGCTVSLYNVSGASEQLIDEVKHYGTVPSKPLQNPLSFSFDLTRLKNSPPQKRRIERITGRKMLWAFYYPWYHINDWSSLKLRDRPVFPYVSSNSNDVARQIEQAQRSGIDGFISSWWGPGTYTDKNLKILLKAAEQPGFSVTIYLETLQRGQPRDEETIFNSLSYAISTYGGHPAFMKVNGKPLIVLWSTNKLPLDAWKRILIRLRTKGLDAVYLGMGYQRKNLEVFDGVHRYGIFDVPNLLELYSVASRRARYYPLLEDSAESKIWVATVQPGYDERLLPNRKGHYKDRNDGDYYRATFDAAIKSDPDWIFITTWNEWWEHTYIEPSVLYGDLYLRITREFAQRWKENRASLLWPSARELSGGME
jgi:hypothetical protein